VIFGSRRARAPSSPGASSRGHDGRRAGACASGAARELRGAVSCARGAVRPVRASFVLGAIRRLRRAWLVPAPGKTSPLHREKS
jgi:hypothetical protein